MNEGVPAAEYRRDRIERLLYELRYEIERGLMGHEIEETMNYRFIFPYSQSIKDGTVFCEYRMRPIPFGYWYPGIESEPERLRVIDGGANKPRADGLT